MMTIVLLPGMDGTGTLFHAFAAALGNSFKVVVVRYPAREALGYDALTEIARRALPTEGDFILLGESFSGPIAVALACERPAGLRGLVLCSTFVANPRPAFARVAFLVHALPVGLAPFQVLSYFLLGRAANPALKAELKSAVSQVSGAAFRARLRAVMAVDVSARLKKVAVPVLYLQASQDRLVPPSAAETIGRLLLAIELVRIDAPHCLLQVAAGQAADAVQQFVAKGGGPGALVG